MVYQLKTRIAITVSALTIILISLFAWVALSHFEHEFKEETVARLADTLHVSAAELEGKFVHAQLLLERIAQNFPRAILDDSQQAQEYLYSQANALLTFDNGILLFSPHGPLKAVIPLQEDMLGIDFSYRDYFRITSETRQSYLSHPFRSRQQHGHPIIMLTEPILDQDGNLLAILGGSLDLSGHNFLGHLAKVPIGHSGYYLLFDQSGNLVLHPNPNKILQPADHFISKKLLTAFQVKSQGHVDSVEVEGTSMLGVFQHLAPTGWTLLALYPTDELHVPIRSERANIILALLFLSIVTILLVRTLTNLLTAPLLRLTAEVRHQINSDEVFSPPPAGSYSELGGLAESIRSLMLSADTRRQDLADQLSFLRNLLETIPSPIFCKDANFLYLDCNRAFEDYIGIKRKDLIGKSVFDIAPPDLAEVYHQADLTLWKDQKQQTYEASVPYADGSIHDVVFYKNIFHNAIGKPVGMIGIIHDISERKRHDEELQQALDDANVSRNQIDNILRHVADGLIVFDPQNNVTLINQVARNQLGLGSRKVVNRHFLRLFTDRKLRQQAKDFLAARGPDGALTDFIFTRSGAEYQSVIQARSSVMRSRDGEVSGIVTLLHDVTRERELDRIKSEFISTAAHEIRTPMSIIMGYSELLLNPGDFGVFSAEEQRDFLEEIYRKSDSLSRIVDDLFDISRIEAGQPIPLEYEPTDLNIVIREVVERYATLKDSHVFDLDLKVAALSHADRDKMTQVFENLISNAVKYSPAGGTITVSSQQFGGRQKIIVADQGIGMSPAQIDRVFDKFYRADSSSTAISGLGLGMSIIEAIIHGHGGEVSVASELGKGTQITIELPLAVDTPETLPAPTE